MSPNEAPVFIFVHGGPGMDEYLEQSFAKPMADLGLRTLFYAQVRSENLEDLTRQLSEKIRSAPSEKVILVGHSWGGLLIAHTLDCQAERKVQGLVFMNSPFSSDFDAVHSEELKKRGLKNPTPAEIFLSQTERGSEEAQQLLTKVLASTDEVYLNKVYASFVGKADMTSFLKNLDLPTLFVIGDEDLRVPLACQLSYAKLVKNSQTLRIPKGGHFCYLLNPRHVAEAIAGYLG